MNEREVCVCVCVCVMTYGLRARGHELFIMFNVGLRSLILMDSVIFSSAESRPQPIISIVKAELISVLLALKCESAICSPSGVSGFLRRASLRCSLNR